MKTKSFDCVELQRQIRKKLVEQAEMDLDKFFDLIKDKKKTNITYRNLEEKK